VVEYYFEKDQRNLKIYNKSLLIIIFKVFNHISRPVDYITMTGHSIKVVRIACVNTVCRSGMGNYFYSGPGGGHLGMTTGRKTSQHILHSSKTVTEINYCC
jgi:hypothetical protein